MSLTPQLLAECERLNHLFKTHATITQKEFAKRYQLGTPANLWQYLNGRRALNLEVAVKIAGGLGVQLADFSPRLAQKQSELSSPNIGPVVDMQKKVPILAYVQAGCPNGGDVAERQKALDEGDFVYADSGTPDGCYALIVRGRSMEPDFQEGDVVLVDPDAAPAPGDYVIARREDPLTDGCECTFKKYRPRGFNERGQLVFELVPLNPDFPTYRSDVDRLTITGTLIEHRRKLRRS